MGWVFADGKYKNGHKLTLIKHIQCINEELLAYFM